MRKNLSPKKSSTGRGVAKATSIRPAPFWSGFPTSLGILPLALLGTTFAAPEQPQKQTVTLYMHGKPRVVDATTQVLPNAERYLSSSGPSATPTRDMSDHAEWGKIERVLTREENLAANIAYERAAAAEKTDLAGSIPLYAKAADLGNIVAARRVGELYFYVSKRHNVANLSQEQALRYLNKAASANDLGALEFLGNLYSHDKDFGCEDSPLAENYTKAAAYYQQAVDKGQGSPGTIGGIKARLGRMYAAGQGVPRDLAKAEKLLWEGWAYLDLGELYEREARSAQDAAARQALYAKAAKSFKEWPANAGALFALGNLYAAGSGVEKSDAKAHELWEQAAAKGSAAAKFVLEGVSLETLKNSPTPDAVKTVQKAAEGGNLQARYELGVAFRDGLGMPKDSAQAAKWFQLAADDGQADGAYALGLLYAQGNGVKRSRARAISLYERAANLGQSEAALELARAYEQGNGVDRDPAKARSYFLAAAQAGSDEAQYAYARQLAKSDNNNLKDVTTWLAAAADQGHAAAERDCLKLFFTGFDVPFSARANSPVAAAAKVFEPTKILQYAKALADSGDPKGIYYLARCYREGIGTSRDDGKASELLNSPSAAASGNPNAKPAQVDSQNRG